MALIKPAQMPTVTANIPALLKELMELGQRLKPVEQQRSEQSPTIVIRGK
jgi:hypothetical protein